MGPRRVASSSWRLQVEPPRQRRRRQGVESASRRSCIAHAAASRSACLTRSTRHGVLSVASSRASRQDRRSSRACIEIASDQVCVEPNLCWTARRVKFASAGESARPPSGTQFAASRAWAGTAYSTLPTWRRALDAAYRVRHTWREVPEALRPWREPMTTAASMIQDPDAHSRRLAALAAFTSGRLHPRRQRWTLAPS